ncbi:MAG: hypothetical protein A4S09_10655 [Proteobacteria bacterium SG_bin7]|nr:MAG: hypothetical protein A4S09_10655 [Proteobacteria bacterium SG_bin7]
MYFLVGRGLNLEAESSKIIFLVKLFHYVAVIGLVLSLAYPVFAAPNVNSEVQSFKNWKTQKVKEAEAIVRRAKLTPHKENHEEELYRALLSLEMSKDLTVNDYFVIYLSNHRAGRKAFQTAVKKLSDAELANLLWTLKPHPDIIENAPAKSPIKSPNTSN